MSRKYDITDPASFWEHQVKWSKRKRFVDRWFGWCWLPFEIEPDTGTGISWYPIKRIFWDIRFRFRRLFCKHPDTRIAFNNVTHCDDCLTKWFPDGKHEVYTCKDRWH